MERELAQSSSLPKEREVKATSIGGQALMEGILMKGPELVAIATRKPGSDEIKVKLEPAEGLTTKYKLFQLPFFRGIGALVDSFARGSKALEYSAEQLDWEEEEKPGFFESFFIKVFGEKGAEKVMSFLMVFSAVVIAFGIFFFVPTWVAGLFRPLINNNLVLNLIEGVIRIIFFLIYVIAISKLDELNRVFMYHGAEHKTIAAYEHGEDLTVENVRKYPRVHARCGTSFLANLVILSALLMSFFGWPNPLLRFAIRLLMIPILVGLTYELNVWTAKFDNFLSKALRAPGMFIQKVATVKEPSDEMIEVAIEAMEAVIPEDHSDIL